MSLNIEKNYNKSVDILRFDEDESGEGESYITHIEDVACHIQPLDESTTEDLTGNFGKDWLMFCASQDIREGDRVVEGDFNYQVVGVKRFEFLGQARHMELRIRKAND